MGRAQRATPWWQRIPLGAVAAALVVVALIGAISLLGQGGGDDDTATAALDQADDSGEAGGGSDAADESMAATLDSEATPESGAPAGGGSTPAERPAYADYEQLAGGLRDELAAPASTTAPDEGDDGADSTERAADAESGAEPSDPCGAVALLGLDPPAVLLVRSVVVGPDEVTAVVHDAADGRRLAVVDDATCSVVLDRPL